MIQDPNPTDYPHLEVFIDWMYDHVEELPADVETLKARIQYWTPTERKEQMQEDVDRLLKAAKHCLPTMLQSDSNDAADNLQSAIESVESDASNPQEQASSTAKTLTQKEIEERNEATTDWFDSLADQEARWSPWDDGRNPDGTGMSYAERNL